MCGLKVVDPLLVLQHQGPQPSNLIGRFGSTAISTDDNTNAATLKLVYIELPGGSEGGDTGIGVERRWTQVWHHGVEFGRQVVYGALTACAAKPLLQCDQGVQRGIVGITTTDLQIVLAIGIPDRREDITVPSDIPRLCRWLGMPRKRATSVAFNSINTMVRACTMISSGRGNKCLALLKPSVASNTFSAR